MGRTYVKDTIKTTSGIPFLIGTKAPLDVRTVLDSVEDLKDRNIATSAYIGLTVYIVQESSFYVCIKQARSALNDNDVWDYWKRVDVDYSVRIVESESNLTDGTTIMFPYQGMMAYVTSESALYILTTKGVESAKDINNWRKISATSSTAPAIDKVGIDVAPEGGSGLKIAANKGVIVDDYVNVENYIKAKYVYTSKGVNSCEPDPNFTYETVRLSKGGESYIELYATGDNWMMINDPDGLGLSVTVDGVDYTSGESIAKGTNVCFGVDVQFTDGWKISYGDGETRDFVSDDYDLIDIYRREYSPEVYAYFKDVDVRLLTEDDLNTILHSIIVDLGESDSDSDTDESPTLQEVIVQMNNSINKLEQTVVEVEPDSIEHSDIDQLFS
jgi:hypothetical protein